MEDIKVLSTKMYDMPKRGYTVLWCEPVEIIGERVIEDDGKQYNCYLYNKLDYRPENGLPFIAVKNNIVVEGI